VSATGPGTQPQIIKKSTGGQKKDVQIKDAKGWADLSKGATKNKTSLQRDESDALWKEFKGKEQEQNDLKEQRKALEEEETRKKQAAAEDELRRRQEEDRKQREAEEAEARKKEEMEQELRKRQSLELDMMNKKAKEDAELDLMKQAGHGDADEHLDDLDIGGGDDVSDAEDEAAMDI
jgi:preprotein translocase subunit SecD